MRSVVMQASREINVNKEIAALNKLRQEIAELENQLQRKRLELEQVSQATTNRISKMLESGYSFDDPFVRKLFPMFGLDFNKIRSVQEFHIRLQQRKGEPLLLCFPEERDGANGKCTSWHFYLGILSGEKMGIPGESSLGGVWEFPFATYVNWQPGFNLIPSRKNIGALRTHMVRDLIFAIAGCTLNTDSKNVMLLWKNQCKPEVFRDHSHPLQDTNSGWQGFEPGMELLGIDISK